MSPRRVIGFLAREYGLSLLFVVFALAVWEIAARGLSVPDYLLPLPSAVFVRLYGSLPTLLGHARATLVAAMGGFLLGGSAGAACAIAMARSRTVERMLYPLVISSQTFPKEALAPVFLLWFGFGLLPKIIIAGLISFFPVVINTTRGLLSVDPLILELMRSLSASQRQVFVKVRLPNAIPYLFAALKMCVTLSVIGAVVGEFVGSSEGLGHLVRLANSELATDLMFAALIVLGAMGTALFLTVESLEKVLLRRWGGATGDELRR